MPISTKIYSCQNQTQVTMSISGRHNPPLLVASTISTTWGCWLPSSYPNLSSDSGVWCLFTISSKPTKERMECTTRCDNPFCQLKEYAYEERNHLQTLIMFANFKRRGPKRERKKTFSCLELSSFSFFLLTIILNHFFRPILIS